MARRRCCPAVLLLCLLNLRVAQVAPLAGLFCCRNRVLGTGLRVKGSVSYADTIHVTWYCVIMLHRMSCTSKRFHGLC